MVKTFKNLDKLSDYCLKNKNYCEKHRKQLAVMFTTLVLKKSGYKNLKDVDTIKIYKELKKISENNCILPANSGYLSTHNDDILNDVFKYGSNMLKDFILKNGFNFKTCPRVSKIKTLKDGFIFITRPSTVKIRKSRVAGDSSNTVKIKR